MGNEVKGHVQKEYTPSFYFNKYEEETEIKLMQMKRFQEGAKISLVNHTSHITKLKNELDEKIDRD